jgi:hypothetical protein
VSFDAGYSYNDNEYLLNNNWYSLGANVTWNLFNVFKYGAMSDNADAKVILEKERKLALSLAVITQVHLANIRYQQASEEYELSKKYLDVSQGIYDQAINANELDMNSDLVFIKEKLSYLLATLRHSAAYANMQNSYGRIYASMGINKDSDVEYKKDNLPTLTNEPVVTEMAIEELVTEELVAPPVNGNESIIPETVVNTPLENKKAGTRTVVLALSEVNYILIHPGETLKISGEEYVVQEGDAIADLSAASNDTIETIIKNNLWLVDQNRLMHKW